MKRVTGVKLRGSNLLLCLTMLIMVVTSMGCATKGYYAVQSHPRMDFAADAQPAATAPTVEVIYEFKSNGVYSSIITQKYRWHVMDAVKKTGLFSKVNEEGVASDIKMVISMNNVLDGIGGAIMAGCMEGCTFGIVGSKVTDNYEIDSTYTPKGKDALPMKYNYGITATSGWLGTTVEGGTNLATSDDAFYDILNQLILKWTADLKEKGVL